MLPRNDIQISRLLLLHQKCDPGMAITRFPHVGIYFNLLFINSRPFISTILLAPHSASSRESWRCSLRGATGGRIPAQDVRGTSIYRYADGCAGRMTPHALFACTENSSGNAPLPILHIIVRGKASWAAPGPRQSIPIPYRRPVAPVATTPLCP